MHFLQLLRHDGLPPFPLKTVRFGAFFIALRYELDERVVKIECCDARRRARREMHAVETAARWAKRGRDPPKRLGICFPVAFTSLLEDRED